MNNVQFPFNLKTSEGTVVECTGENNAVVLSYGEKSINIIDDELVEFVEALTGIAKAKWFIPTQGDEDEQALTPPVLIKGVQLPEGAIRAAYIESVWVAAMGADSVDGVAYVGSPGIVRIDPVKELFRSLEFSRTDLLAMLALLDAERDTE